MVWFDCAQCEHRARVAGGGGAAQCAQHAGGGGAPRHHEPLQPARPAAPHALPGARQGHLARHGNSILYTRTHTHTHSRTLTR